MTDDTLTRMRRRIERLENQLAASTDEDDGPDDGDGGRDERPGGRMSRRSLLQAVGVAGLVGYGASTATADPQGQLGTESSPLRRLYLETLAGGLAEDGPVSRLDGPGLRIDDETLRAVLTGIERTGDGVSPVDEADGHLTVRGITDGSGIDVDETGGDIVISNTRSSGGGSADGENLGSSGPRVFAGTSGDTLQFRRLASGTGVSLSEGTDAITIAASGGSNDGATLGTGDASVYAGMNGDTLEFRHLDAGTGISLTQNGEGITTSTTTSGTNLGTSGEGVYAGTTGDTLEFRRFVAGSNVSLSAGSDAITVSATDTDTHASVSDSGTSVLSDVTDIDFAANLAVTDDGDGSVTVEAADTDTRTDVSDSGTGVVTETGDIDFRDNLTVTDDGDGTATVDATDTRTDVSDSGTGVVTDVTDIDFGTNLSVGDDGDGSVTVDATDTGEVNDGANLGNGTGVYAGKSGTTLDFRSFVGAGSVSISSASGEITVTGDGEANTASNVGTGDGVFKQKNGTDLEFKSLIAGSNLAITSGTDALTLDATDTDTHTNVSSDGTQVLSDVDDINFGADLTVADDGDGTVTVDGSGTDTRTDVSNDGTGVETDVSDINFRNSLSATADGDGTVTTDVALSISDITQNGASDGQVITWDGSASSWKTDFPGTTTSTAFDLYVNGAVGFRLSPGDGNGQANVVGGHPDSVANGHAITISGGGLDVNSKANSVYDAGGTIGGGKGNQAGVDNGDTTTANEATVSGGYQNTASGDKSTVGGGNGNHASAGYSTIAGGNKNTTNGGQSYIGGGYANTTAGTRAAIPGGNQNQANGADSFAAGQQAVADHLSTFVWGDSTSAQVGSTGSDQFIVRASGGVWIGDDSNPGFPNGGLIETSSGAYLSSGGTWTDASSRAIKSDFEPVNGPDVLEKVQRLSVSTWSYDDDPDDVRHCGPVAEDFYETFGFGEDDEHLASLDTAGVALAAIQGLAERLERKDERIGDLEAENEALESEVAALQAENEALSERCDELEDRLAAIEERLDDCE